MAGRVCNKHNEWCPTGECRWCEPPAEVAQAAMPPAFERAYADAGFLGYSLPFETLPPPPQPVPRGH